MRMREYGGADQIDERLEPGRQASNDSLGRVQFGSR
jgi:hypothetical protein